MNEEETFYFSDPNEFYNPTAPQIPRGHPDVYSISETKNAKTSSVSDYYHDAVRLSLKETELQKLSYEAELRDEREIEKLIFPHTRKSHRIKSLIIVGCVTPAVLFVSFVSGFAIGGQVRSMLRNHESPIMNITYELN